MVNIVIQRYIFLDYSIKSGVFKTNGISTSIEGGDLYDKIISFTAIKHYSIQKQI